MPWARERLAADTDMVALLARLPPAERARKVRRLGLGEVESFDGDWPGWAHRGQLAPPDDWRCWVLMAGRGFGKTLAGAQWVFEEAKRDGSLRVALVAATIDEARAVMVEGRSGLLAVAHGRVEEWNPSRRTLRFEGGAEATLFSGASPDKLRGPEHHLAWCDELAKWERPGETWDNLQLGLRLGTRPRALVTTTPRPGPTLRRIMAEPGCVATGGRTADNPHVSRAYRDTVERLYRGTRLGAQELDGLLLPDGGALWTPEVIERCRVAVRSGSMFLDYARNERERGNAIAGEGGEVPPPPFVSSVVEKPINRAFTRAVIGVDPPSGDGTCGIVACAIDADGIGHVLADHSVTARTPEGWARAVADAVAVHRAESVVAERNQGGKMVGSVLLAADRRLRVRLVHASDGKAVRAEPVALLFEANRVRLHGRFPELEAELLGLVSGAPYQGPGGSPDRADAMVWALTELMLGRAGEAKVRTL